MPTLNIAAQTVQPGAHAGSWHNVPAGVTSLVCAVDLSAFTDATTIFGLRIEWRRGSNDPTPETAAEAWIAGGPPADAGVGGQALTSPGTWYLVVSRDAPTLVAVQARYVAGVGSLDANGAPQLSGGSPVTIGVSTVTLS